MFDRLRRKLLGPARDPMDKSIHHQISLIAFLAWVGVGADGLSSSCYGPEETFRALGEHRFLAVFLAGAMAFTVAVISAGYSYVIEAFPSGGGGYVVATKRLGAVPGLVAGSALLVDYVLTISISIASSADYLFSFLPVDWRGFHVHSLKLPAAAAAILGLIVLNLRGLKESVMFLMPVFLVFLATHAVAIAVGVGGHAAGLPAVARGAWGEASRMSQDPAVGLAGMLLLLLRAYSLGAGTYTGVEAVSNSMQALREPKVRTGRRTMLYLALSLAFVSSGILLSYLLLGVRPQEGKTLNAVMLETITAGWGSFGKGFVFVALVSSAALLLVAAQTGFIDGPRVMANMAVDRWMPQRFARLSDRLVVQDGVLLMGGASLVFLLATGGSVDVLVVMYSINVFITFVLSQLSMVRHWWTVRAQTPGWRLRLAVNGVAFVLCLTILLIMLKIKGYDEALEGHRGAWVTLAVTAGVCFLAFRIRRHYADVRRMLIQLDHLAQGDLVGTAAAPAPAEPDANAPTAVLMVSGYNGISMHSFLTVHRLYPGYFRNWVFVEVGVIDYDRFKGAEDVEELRRRVESDLGRFAGTARRAGFAAETFSAMGIDAVDEIEKLCPVIAKKYPRAHFFGGQLVFPKENVLTRLLHAGAIYEIQRRLQFMGIPVTVLPIRVFDRRAARDGTRPDAS